MEIKRVPKDKKIILTVARHLRELYSNYKPTDKFSYSILLDKKNKSIGLKIRRLKGGEKR